MRNFLVWFYLKVFKKLDTPEKIINFSFQQHKTQAFLSQPDRNIHFSFQELEERVKKLIHFFSKQLLETGNVVVFLSENGFEYFEIRAAAHLSSIVFFALPVYIVEEDIINFLRKTRPRIVFYRDNSSVNVASLQSQTAVEQFIDLDSAVYAEINQQGQHIDDNTHHTQKERTENNKHKAKNGKHCQDHAADLALCNCLVGFDL